MLGKLKKVVRNLSCDWKFCIYSLQRRLKKQYLSNGCERETKRFVCAIEMAWKKFHRFEFKKAEFGKCNREASAIVSDVCISHQFKSNYKVINIQLYCLRHRRSTCIRIVWSAFLNHKHDHCFRWVRIYICMFRINPINNH